MDELYNEVCDIIQEQYDSGELTEEDATALMEAAYDRYVVETMNYKEEKDVIKAMTDKSKEFDAEITKLMKNGETRKAYHAATSAAKFFHDKQIELKDDLEAIKKKNTIGIATCIGNSVFITPDSYIQISTGLPRKLDMFEQHFNKRAKIIKAQLETSNNKK